MKPAVMSWDGQRPLSGTRSVFLRARWSQIDWPVFLIAVILLAVGLIFVRAMAEMDELKLRSGVAFSSHLKKVAVSLPFLLLGVVLRPRWLRGHAYAIYVAAVLLLALVPFVGEYRNNARRWIALPFGFDLQPSELAKLGLILALARALYRNRLARLGDWLVPAFLALLPMVLVSRQPDLGTALLIAPLTLGMCYLAGARGRVVLGIVAAGALVLFLAWQLEWIQDYQKRRVDTWLASFDAQALIENKKGASFHAYHARVAVGNGGFSGTGLGRGIANQAGHLPERESDSIFAVIAEEGGLVGVGFLVALYVLMIAMILRTAGRVRERFSRLVVGGVGLFFACHFFINTGVTLGLLPMTGLTLPLLSTGGSSLLASFAALGLALGLATHHEPSLDRDAFEP